MKIYYHQYVQIIDMASLTSSLFGFIFLIIIGWIFMDTDSSAPILQSIGPLMVVLGIIGFASTILFQWRRMF